MNVLINLIVSLFLAFTLSHSAKADSFYTDSGDSPGENSGIDSEFESEVIEAFNTLKRCNELSQAATQAFNAWVSCIQDPDCQGEEYEEVLEAYSQAHRLARECWKNNTESRTCVFAYEAALERCEEMHEEGLERENCESKASDQLFRCKREAGIAEPYASSHYNF